MTCFRKIVSALTLLLPLFFIQPAFAEPDSEDADKIEQRESGGKLLRFLFGDDEEEDGENNVEETDVEDPATEDKARTEAPAQTPTETVGTPSVPEPVIIQSSEPQAIETQPVTQDPPKVVAVPGQEREGLAPPPGFTETVPANSPAEDVPSKNLKKDIMVEQLPASSSSPNTAPASTAPSTRVVSAQTEPSPEEVELQRLSKENPVVAVVEGDRIYWEDIMQAARKLPEQYQGNLETMFPLLLDRAIDLKLLAHAGADADVDQDDAVKRKLALAEEKIIRDAFLEQKLDEMISESMLKDRYFEMLRENIINAEIRARHILVDTRNEALALIVALENGANFPLLAKKFSRGPSAEKGGDLGWFKRKDMDPEFAASAFDLKKGEFTKAPVSTEFGWHVILLEDKREVKQPTFESMRAEIKEIVSRDLIAVMVRELREDADISVFPAK